MIERLQKIIAAHGGISRRAAEKLIESGLVTVNGSVAVLGDKADAESDMILVEGTPIDVSSDKKVYIMLNKPVGYVTTMKDERGRKTVTQLLPDIQERVYPVGRLDINSAGLLLFTNDGEFANTIMHPSFEKDKRYRVYVEGDLDLGIRKLLEPMELDGVLLSKPDAFIKTRHPGGGVIDIVIHEGRNRQVRRMCKAAGLKVVRLTRLSIGPLKLGNLKTGEWRYLSDEEVAMLNCK